MSPYWLLLAFPFFFVGLWIAVCQLLSLLLGWRSLAAVYPQVGVPEGKLLRGRSAAIGIGSYRGVMNFTAGPSHLHMAPFAIFRFGHAPISIPWSDISATPHRGTFVENIELRFSGAPQARVRIDTRTSNDLVEASAGQFVPAKLF